VDLGGDERVPRAGAACHGRAQLLLPHTLLRVVPCSHRGRRRRGSRLQKIARKVIKERENFTKKKRTGDNHKKLINKFCYSVWAHTQKRHYGTHVSGEEWCSGWLGACLASTVLLVIEGSGSWHGRSRDHTLVAGPTCQLHKIVRKQEFRIFHRFYKQQCIVACVHTTEFLKGPHFCTSIN
jgi:hypothetical protein